MLPAAFVEKTTISTASPPSLSGISPRANLDVSPRDEAARSPRDHQGRKEDTIAWVVGHGDIACVPEGSPAVVLKFGISIQRVFLFLGVF